MGLPGTTKTAAAAVKATSSTRARSRQHNLKPQQSKDPAAAAAIKSLPGDLLINEVLGRVASSSFTDLFNAKLCCKDFLGAAENDYILERVSIDKFPVIPWCKSRDEVTSFLDRCKDCGNPEALFRKGMVEYFSHNRTELGIEYLERAAKKGHAGASYACGIILMSRGGESAQRGLKLLNSLKTLSKVRPLRIRECRARAKSIVREMWINNHIAGQPITCYLEKGKACIQRKRSWNHDEDELMYCDGCRWTREVNSFSEMLHGW